MYGQRLTDKPENTFYSSPTPRKGGQSVEMLKSLWDLWFWQVKVGADSVESLHKAVVQVLYHFFLQRKAKGAEALWCLGF